MDKPINKNKRELYKVALAVILFYFLFLGLKLYQNHFDISRFILFGDKVVSKEVALQGNYVLPNSKGYDGQFYYRLALAPFTNEKTAFGITLDQPLRQQRILYPLLSRIFSFGNQRILPFAMFFVNILSLLLLIWLSPKLIEDKKQSKWLVILIPIFPTFLISITRDLTEILSSALLLGAYLLFVKNKKYLSVLVFTLAALARETTLIFPIVLALYSFGLFLKNKNKEELIKSILFSVPFIIFAIWQIILYRIWGQSSLSVDTGLNIVWPFQGFIKAFSFKNVNEVLKVFEIIYLFIVIFLGAINFKKIHDWPLKISWALYVFLFTLYSKWIWKDDLNFFRACTELFIFSFILIISGDNKKAKKLIFWLTVLMTILMTIKIYLIGHWPLTIGIF